MYRFYLYYFKRAFFSRIFFLIFLISGFLIFWLNGYFPYVFSRNLNIVYKPSLSYDNTAAIYAYSKMLAFSSSISTIFIFLSIFAAIIGSFIFRQDVEDNSLLVLISKPISKSKLNLSKLLAYWSLMIIFSFYLSFIHSIGVAVGSSMIGITINQLLYTFFISFLISIVISFIFSSIALIFSSFLSSKFVISFTILFGLSAPLTIILNPLTYQEKNVRFFQTFDSLFGLNDSFYRELEDVNKTSLIDITNDNLYVNNPEMKLIYLINTNKLDILNSNKTKDIMQGVKITDLLSEQTFDNIFSEKNKIARQEKVYALRNSYIFSYEKEKKFSNLYKYLVYFDTSYQTLLLGSFISDSSISNSETKQIYEMFNAYSISSGSGNLGFIRKSRDINYDYKIRFNSNWVNEQNLRYISNKNNTDIKMRIMVNISNYIIKKQDELNRNIQKNEFHILDIDFSNIKQEKIMSLFKNEDLYKNWLSSDLYDYYSIFGSKNNQHHLYNLVSKERYFIDSINEAYNKNNAVNELYYRFNPSDYLNRKKLLILYISISILLTSISIFIINRKNIR